MEYITGNNIVLDSPSAITLGNFDGIHLGHRKLINTVKQYAQKEHISSVVCSFLPHPKLVFKTENNFALILTPEEKKERIKNMGVDMYIDFPFDINFASIAPKDFAEKILFKNLKTQVIVVGENYTFGYKKLGTPEMLKEIGKKYDVKVISIPSVIVDGERVSSTYIRKLLDNTKLKEANKLLCEPYSIIGTVIEGKKLGRKLGFPTINILANPVKLFPVNGVYATKTIYNNFIYNSITNIGYNPTVNGKIKTVETNVFNFNKFVYGEKVEVQFLEFIRPEMKFDSVDKLKEQISLDTQSVNRYFESNN